MGLKSSQVSRVARGGGLAALLPLIILVLGTLFHNNFLPGLTLFSNDGPLGQQVTACNRLPEAFSGTWQDINTIGVRGGAFPSITYGLLWLLGPIGFSKFYAPMTLLILGLGAWCFFQQMRFAPLASVLGGLAAALNSSFFSAACWGVGTAPLTVGMEFFALAALVDTTSPRRWFRVMLAGLLVGMGVMEGADIGAIFSIYVAAFALYQAWAADGPRIKTLAIGVTRIAVVAVFAGFLAFHAVSVLVTTQIKGIVGTQQDKETKEQHWDFATQWSLPKREALGFMVPGLFGYRMDTQDGGAYWGAVGRDPNWDRYFANGKQGPPPGGTIRFGGGSPYAGILVLLIGVWAVFQGVKKKDSAFSLDTRRWIWFWVGVFVISLLLAFGRFAPFYQFLYALPYFSTIRNPAKFTYLCNWALVVLFGYGLNGLFRQYMEYQAAKGAVVRESFTGWWRRIRGFDRRWTAGCVVCLGGTALAWLIYASSGDAFEKYLQEVQFDPAMAHLIAKFSAQQAGIFLFLFACAILLVILTLSGAFRGQRANWGAILLGLLVVVDLGRANEPWIITWDYEQKYASNPIIDILRKAPFEHRVGSLPRWILPNVPPKLAELEQYFLQLYGIEWIQHHFLYYNIQTPEVIQMPRMAEDLAAYEAKFFPFISKTNVELWRVGRHWQLTNTGYLLGSAAFLDLLNQWFDPAHHQFRIAERFEIVPKPGIARPTRLDELTAVLSTNGPFALFEFTGALPRAKLYSNWRVSTNDQETLDQLANANFDPQTTVLVSGGVPVPAASATTNQIAGEVKFTSYAPKDIVFNAVAIAPSVLLLNDRFDPDWKVFVDDKPEMLLRCNYIMRGVFLSPGKHKVEFRFIQPMGTFYVSLTAIILGVMLCGILLNSPPSSGAEPEKTRAKPAEKVPVAARS